MADLFQVAASHERAFEAHLLASGGYKRITTFVNDLVIAELVSGFDGIKDTHNRVTKEWKNNLKYYTEYVMALNFLCWVRYDQQRTDVSKLYSTLYHCAYNVLWDTFEGDQDAARYIFQTLD